MRRHFETIPSAYPLFPERKNRTVTETFVFEIYLASGDSNVGSGPILRWYYHNGKESSLINVFLLLIPSVGGN